MPLESVRWPLSSPAAISIFIACPSNATPLNLSSALRASSRRSNTTYAAPSDRPLHADRAQLRPGVADAVNDVLHRSKSSSTQRMLSESQTCALWMTCTAH